MILYIPLHHQLDQSASFISLCFSPTFFILLFTFFSPHSPLHFFCNPPKAISCVSLSLFLPVTPFHHHSFSLQPHLWSREYGKWEESTALACSNNTFVLSFSPDMIRRTQLGDTGSLYSSLSPFSSPVGFFLLVTLPDLTSLENLNLSFIVPPLTKLVFPCS